MDERMKFANLNNQPIVHVNATPDNEYPLRILQAFRYNCDCRFSSGIDGTDDLPPFLKEMNKLNDQRAEILDKAIKILEKNL